MKLCYYCHKPIFPWQKQYLGSTPAHASCDIEAFTANVRELVGTDLRTTEEWAEKQITLRKQYAYS